MQVIGSFLVTCPHFPETTTSKLWTSSWSLMISPIIILMYATLNDHSLGILLIVYFWNCLKYGKVFNFKLRFILHQECKEFFCLQGERLHLSFCSLFFYFLWTSICWYTVEGTGQRCRLFCCFSSPQHWPGVMCHIYALPLAELAGTI